MLFFILISILEYGEIYTIQNSFTTFYAKVLSKGILSYFVWGYTPFISLYHWQRLSPQFVSVCSGRSHPYPSTHSEREKEGMHGKREQQQERQTLQHKNVFQTVSFPSQYGILFWQTLTSIHALQYNKNRTPWGNFPPELKKKKKVKFPREELTLLGRHLGWFCFPGPFKRMVGILAFVSIGASTSLPSYHKS